MSTSISDLQSALRLLTMVSSQSDSKTPSDTSAATPSSSAAATSSASSISGIVDQARFSAQSGGQLLSLQIASSTPTAGDAGAEWQGGANMTLNQQISDGQVSGTLEMSDMTSRMEDLQTVRENLWVSENSMTSQQLSDAAYSQGLGLLNVTDPEDPATESFTTAVNDEIAGFHFMAAVGNDLAKSEASQNLDELSQIMDAYQNHTLTIQNAVDVQGLDYTSSNVTSIQNSSGTSSGSTSWNKNFVSNNPDGQQHYLLQLGYAEMYLTW